jgi:hypothetical protein
MNEFVSVTTFPMAARLALIDSDRQFLPGRVKEPGTFAPSRLT